LVYVNNRKLKKSFIGNTLEKPGIILKRKKVRDTVEGNETLKTAR